MPVSPPTIRAPRPHRSEAGFSLIEAAIGLVLLAVAVLAHATTTVSEHRLSREEQVRSEGLHVITQFLERLRSDEDWAGLYARLRSQEDLAVVSGSGTARLDDGRAAFRPTVYFSDFTLSEAMPEAYVLVEVPSAPADGALPDDPRILREDVKEPRFGLPADLDGDGTVGPEARDGDYAVLPVRVILRWTPHGEAPRELKIATWLRGNR